MIKAKLIIDLLGGLPDFIKAEKSEIKQFVKDEIYLLPNDYDFSNGYFEIIEEKKKSKEDKQKWQLEHKQNSE